MRRPVLRYHGGKFALAPWIISHFPPHRFYVEPFGGAASVLMCKPRSFAEVYNDAWSVVVTVFRVLRDPVQAAELERLLRLTPFSREEFEEPWPEDAPPVEIARRAILRSFAGFGSAGINPEHKTGFRGRSVRAYTTPAHDWARYPDHIRLFCDRLQGVAIENRPALDLIRSMDGPDVLFYVDPPYVRSTRNAESFQKMTYAHDMTDAQHEELAAALLEVRGMVVLSGYDHAIYSRAFGSWQRVEAATFADGARDRLEVLWLNPAAASRQRQASLL